jgi:hypothetical protein
VSFDGPWHPRAGAVAAIIRMALAQAFPSVRFVVRYRTSQIYVHPSWVAVSCWTIK